jgi:hypothetical protein
MTHKEKTMRIATLFLTALLLVSFAMGVQAEEKKAFVEPAYGTRGLLDCSAAIPINCGDFVSGSNVGYPANVSAYSCVGWNEAGGEVVYALTFTSGPGPDGCVAIQATLSNMPCDLDVFILGSCEESDCLAYGNSTALTDIFPEGTYTVYVVVDGYNGAECTYDLQIDCIPGTCPIPDCCPLTNVCIAYDFNEDPQGWFPLACGGAPLWGWGPAPEIPGIACEGVPVTNVLGTALGTNYPAGSGEIAAIGPIPLLPGCNCMELCHFFDTENAYDGGNVKISVDGGATWTLLTPTRGYDSATNTAPFCIPGEPAYSGHGQNTAFLQDCFDVTQYTGQDVWIGFFFGSDSSIQYPGWYIKWLKFGSQDPISIENSSWGKMKSLYR